MADGARGGIHTAMLRDVIEWHEVTIARETRALLAAAEEHPLDHVDHGLFHLRRHSFVLPRNPVTRSIGTTDHCEDTKTA
jgi:hypothetical protein